MARTRPHSRRSQIDPEEPVAVYRSGHSRVQRKCQSHWVSEGTRCYGSARDSAVYLHCPMLPFDHSSFVRNSSLQHFIECHLRAVQVCWERDCRMPALVLLYTGLDIFAWLARRHSSPDVRRSDFVDWCDEFLLPSGFSDCTSLELYAARCGVVHTNTSASRLSRARSVREVIYSWGPDSNRERLQQALTTAGVANHVTVHVERLSAAFGRGAALFVAHAQVQSHLLGDGGRSLQQDVPRPITSRMTRVLTN